MTNNVINSKSVGQPHRISSTHGISDSVGFHFLSPAASQAGKVPSTLVASNELLAVIEARRQSVTLQLNDRERSSLGQFFTPSSVAQFIASLPSLPMSGTVRIIDPGAGIGSLSAALILRILTERPDLLVDLTAVEIDTSLVRELKTTLAACRRIAEGLGCYLTSHIVEADFLGWACDSIETSPFGGESDRFDIVIMNPPYRKVKTGTTERRSLQRINVDVPNLYVAFLAMSCAMLDTGGQIAAITPRSFTNGPYFRSFRRYFFEQMVFDRLHMFESRSKVFAGYAVLQENIIFSARRSIKAQTGGDVVISESVGADEALTFRTASHSEVVNPHDPDCFVHIVTDERDAAIVHKMGLMPTRLPQLNLEVSTGRVVDFRARDYLRAEPAADTVPLLYQGNLRNGGIIWPGTVRKRTSIVACDATSNLLLPSETFVLVKRFTAKEERRRVSASVFEASDVSTNRVAFENHLNVIHDAGRGLDGRLARGLAVWLNSTVVDRYFRSFNGHTQVNATDLRRLPYPTRDELLALADAIGSGPTSDQEKIDALVSACIAVLQGHAV